MTMRSSRRWIFEIIEMAGFIILISFQYPFLVRKIIISLQIVLIERLAEHADLRAVLLVVCISHRGIAHRVDVAVIFDSQPESVAETLCDDVLRPYQVFFDA